MGEYIREVLAQTVPSSHHNHWNAQCQVVVVVQKDPLITAELGANTEDSSCALSIVKKEQSDTATYYCTVAFMNIITFGDGTVLVIKDSEGAHYSSHILLQQPVSEPVHPGNFVTLQCTVLTEICAGGHSVYWFRHGSEESQPGIIYTNGHSKSQCQKSSAADSPTESCVYELTKRNLSLSDAATYYCAVALCGQILFGNGTTLFFNA
ncbi:uncharacterized protein LOC118240127 [Electrophorus electricus]|uniref:uncharacterized protein LOC118240127 n=1 Tax=Electrophorus electricus TaxID=8005 RepID=UPI0015CF89E3|nr:uncharacterized protein LOC118240127 [Electrophorus electricus]